MTWEYLNRYFFIKMIQMIKLTRQNDTIEKIINKSIIMQYEQGKYLVIPWRSKGKEPCTDWLFNTGFLICKEGHDNANNYMKSFAHIWNFEFYRLYYIVKIFLVKYSINDWLHFTSNKLGRISWSTHFYKPAR